MFSSSQVLRFVALAISCSLASHAGAQDERLQGVHYRRDGKGRVVALDYSGGSGLRRAGLQDVSHLERVFIYYGTKLSADDIAVLSTLENVRDLMLGGVSSAGESVAIEGSLDKLVGLKRLRTLWFCKERFRDEDLEFITELPELESVDLFADNDYDQLSLITDRSAEFLRRAKTIRKISVFGGEKLTDKFTDVISKDLPDLESLDLVSSCELTNKSLETLASRCSKLKKLSLSSKHITDDGIRHLTAAKRLEQLLLSSGSLTSACAASVQELKDLRYLRLPITTIDDRALRQLASLPNLEILSLRGPPITDEQFALLAKCPRLESAFVNGSRLSETKVLAVIKNMSKLKHLEVGDNPPLQIAVSRELDSR